ncbi:unnamed protein product [Phytophthora fragariaefolia]|uniref:Unnamed protein product n=1 Tax=Phytophthora fragariaefolia TaxID=1490495 RepID=A0A9W6XN79_9STRA|nr:unnamed protein product [Phytophthora fragariaefolia]
MDESGIKQITTEPSSPPVTPTYPRRCHNKGEEAPAAENAMSKDGALRIEKALLKEKTPTTTTAPRAKPKPRTVTRKRKEVCLPGPYEGPDTSESNMDTPNPDLITGEEGGSNPGTAASRVTKPSEGYAVDVSTSGAEPALTG